MISYFVLGGVVALVVILLLLLGVVVRSLLSSSRQILEINKQLMVLIAMRDVGEGAGRALVASARKPEKDLQGVAKEGPPQTKDSRAGITGQQYSLKVGSQ